MGWIIFVLSKVIYALILLLYFHRRWGLWWIHGSPGHNCWNLPTKRAVRQGSSRDTRPGGDGGVGARHRCVGGCGSSTSGSGEPGWGGGRWQSGQLRQREIARGAEGLRGKASSLLCREQRGMGKICRWQSLCLEGRWAAGVVKIYANECSN